MVGHLARVEERRGEHDDTELFENGHFDTEKDESFTLSWTSGSQAVKMEGASWGSYTMVGRDLWLHNASHVRRHVYRGVEVTLSKHM
jgi:hypothetical protein